MLLDAAVPVRSCRRGGNSRGGARDGGALGHARGGTRAGNGRADRGHGGGGHVRARRGARPPATLSRALSAAHAPRCDSGVSAPPRTSMPAAAGRRRTPLTRRGSEASPAPASTSRGRMGRRRGERRGQTCAGARAPWAGRARSSAFERSAYRHCCRRCCRRCWPTNSERGRRGPRQRKHPLRSPARERRAAGAAAPGEADERRQRPLDNLWPTGAEHGSRSRRAGEKPGPAAGAAAGGDIPQGAAHRRGRASAHGAVRRGEKCGTRVTRVENSLDIYFI